jgi:hypothetical protein
MENKKTLNLDKLESQLDNALAKETKESLTNWLDSKRNKETLEEAAENYASKKLQRPITIYTPLESNVAEYVGFIKGAKWQQEQDKNKYSENDLEVAFFEGRENKLSFVDWFEQFKNK